MSSDKNLYSQAIEEGVGMRNHTDCFGRSGQYLIVLAEAAGMIEPGKRTFHDPAPGKLLPFVRLDFLRNINTTPQSLTGIKRKSPPGIPASAQKRSRDGYLLHACFAGMIPAFVSWIFAACTTTASRFPNVSTTMCRFLPFVFFHRLSRVPLPRRSF